MIFGTTPTVLFHICTITSELRLYCTAWAQTVTVCALTVQSELTLYSLSPCCSHSLSPVVTVWAHAVVTVWAQHLSSDCIEWAQTVTVWVHAVQSELTLYSLSPRCSHSGSLCCSHSLSPRCSYSLSPCCSYSLSPHDVQSEPTWCTVWAHSVSWNPTVQCGLRL